MTTLKEAERIVAKARKDKESKNEKKRIEYCKSIIGKYFIFRNNSWGGDSPKWNVYIKVLGLSPSGYGVYGLSLEDMDTDKMQIEVKTYSVYGNKINYEEISKGEFLKGISQFNRKWGHLVQYMITEDESN